MRILQRFVAGGAVVGALVGGGSAVPAAAEPGWQGGSHVGRHADGHIGVYGTFEGKRISWPDLPIGVAARTVAESCERPMRELVALAKEVDQVDGQRRACYSEATETYLTFRDF